MTSYEQSLELLNGTHTFPDHVIVKAIGLNQNEFELRFLKIITTHLQLSEDLPFTTRMSQSNRHVAVTVEPLFQRAEDVLSLYEAIRGLEDLVMVM